ncbi:EamA family transporter [Fischerella sp. JS2]|uniref:EamA family transporter n=1 Tax=Fischerella sp. JS2 TaxID=2597771 RepID=UPI0028E6CF7B|nr:EamA family transporter [Fischerella sp. JS2]
MTLQEFILLLMSILTSVAGQFFLKMGAIKLGRVNMVNAINHILSIMTTPELLIGLTCYALSAVSYIMLLTRVNLSIAAPSTSLVYIFSVLLGYFIFREPIPLTRLAGISLVMSGVILLVWQK